MNNISKFYTIFTDTSQKSGHQLIPCGNMLKIGLSATESHKWHFTRLTLQICMKLHQHPLLSTYW